MNDLANAPAPDWPRYYFPALIAGAAGLAVSAAGALLSEGLADQFFRSYLVAFLYCLAVSLGGTAVWMLTNVTGGWWGLVTRRLFEAASRALPLVALMFVPLALGLDHVYVWANPRLAETTSPGEEGRKDAGDPAKAGGEQGHAHPLGPNKEAYFHLPFFFGRAVFYFAVWLTLAFFLNRWSARQDRAFDQELSRKTQLLSAAGLGLYGLTMTFAAIDWVMSLTPEWYSSIFGVLMVTGQALPTFSLAILGVVWLSSRYQPHTSVMTPQIWNDLGNLLLAFVMLWAYMSFSQFLLIWSANLPEEIIWYVDRGAGGWEVVAACLALFYFVLPFLLLLARKVKRRPHRLAWVTGAIAVVSYVHLHWLVAPTFSPRQFAVHWMDLTTMVGLGGVWLGWFLWQLKRRPLLPLNDPLFAEAAEHG
jgi:hypothetical protein